MAKALLDRMGNKASGAKVRFDAYTQPSSSRWGAFTSLLALSALLIALGSWVRMNALAWVGIGIVVLAVAVAVHWIITGSKDRTATTDDITRLGNTLNEKIDRVSARTETAINNLTKEIRLARQNRNGETRADE